MKLLSTTGMNLEVKVSCDGVLPALQLDQPGDPWSQRYTHHRESFDLALIPLWQFVHRQLQALSLDTQACGHGVGLRHPYVRMRGLSRIRLDNCMLRKPLLTYWTFVRTANDFNSGGRISNIVLPLTTVSRVNSEKGQGVEGLTSGTS